MLELTVATRSERATSAFEPVAEFVNVSKSYGTGGAAFAALQDVTCRLPRARTSYVFGPSGSGKTTFLNMLGLIDRPDIGSVRILGTDVGTLSDAKAADFVPGTSATSSSPSISSPCSVPARTSSTCCCAAGSAAASGASAPRIICGPSACPQTA